MMTAALLTQGQPSCQNPAVQAGQVSVLCQGQWQRGDDDEDDDQGHTDSDRDEDDDDE